MPSNTDLRRVERAVVLAVLDGDHPAFHQTDISATLSDIASPALDSGLASVSAEGVVETDGELIRASRCVRHLDRLGLICG